MYDQKYIIINCLALPSLEYIEEEGIVCNKLIASLAVSRVKIIKFVHIIQSRRSQMLEESKQQDQLNFSYNSEDNQMVQPNQPVARYNFSLLKTAIVILICFGFYHMTVRVYSVSLKQRQKSQGLKIYNDAIERLQQKLRVLSIRQTPFTEEEKQQFKLLKKSIKQIEGQLLGQDNHDQQQIEEDMELNRKVQQLEDALVERDVLINMINTHAKQEVRRKKIAMFEKIGKKSEFQPEHIRNPWALSRMNLKSQYTDPLQKHTIQQQLKREAGRLEDKYRLSYFIKQLPLCIVVTTRNNAKNYRYEYNLQSIINQDYDNYRIVIVDDASDDGTADLIRAFLRRSNVHYSQYTIIQNTERLTAVPNINRAIKKHCQKQDIAVLISGDDEILGRNVFKILNAVYQSKKPGIAYTNHFFGKLHENDFDRGYSRQYSRLEIRNKNYRFINQNFGHMRTFRVDLFHHIKEEHMKNRDGTWIQATYDQTFIMPMLQMACDSIEYIDEYVYIYNYGTGDNDGEIHHKLQSDAALYVRSLPRYECLDKYQKYVI